MASSPASDGSSPASLPTSPMASSPASDGSSPSSLPTSPMASSPASDGSSPSSLPTSPIQQKEEVSSVEEIRHIVNYAEPEVELKFLLEPYTSLAEARKLLKLVTDGDAGHGKLANPDMLIKKEEALRFIETRLERLRRWKRYVDFKYVKVVGLVSTLEQVIKEGGPGVRETYEAHRYNGRAAVLDVDQDIDEKHFENHIEAIRAFVLETSPGSPAEDGYGSVNNCLKRETKEQMDIAKFNLEYLQVKSRGLELLSGHLHNGIRSLEERFVNEHTFLGASDAEFVRFVDTKMYPREAPRSP